MAAVKDCHTLTSYYIKKYKERYAQDPVVNRHAARWGFDSVLMDMSVADAKEVIDFYFMTNSPRRHSLDWFLYNYEKLVATMLAQAEDAANRARLRKESEERAKEWREKRGNTGITSN
jgi:hypothetical protein